MKPTLLTLAVLAALVSVVALLPRHEAPGVVAERWAAPPEAPSATPASAPEIVTANPRADAIDVPAPPAPSPAPRAEVKPPAPRQGYAANPVPFLSGAPRLDRSGGVERARPPKVRGDTPWSSRSTAPRSPTSPTARTRST